jgi:hypothetical protein
MRSANCARFCADFTAALVAKATFALKAAE